MDQKIKSPLKTQSTDSHSKEEASIQSLSKKVDKILKTQAKQEKMFKELQEELESLSRDFSLTIETLTDHPLVSGVLH